MNRLIHLIRKIGPTLLGIIVQQLLYSHCKQNRNQALALQCRAWSSVRIVPAPLGTHCLPLPPDSFRAWSGACIPEIYYSLQSSSGHAQCVRLFVPSTYHFVIWPFCSFTKACLSDTDKKASDPLSQTFYLKSLSSAPRVPDSSIGMKRQWCIEWSRIYVQVPTYILYINYITYKLDTSQKCTEIHKKNTSLCYTVEHEYPQFSFHSSAM